MEHPFILVGMVAFWLLYLAAVIVGFVCFPLII